MTNTRIHQIRTFAASILFLWTYSVGASGGDSSQCRQVLWSKLETPSIKATQITDSSPENAIRWRLGVGDIDKSEAQRALSSLKDLQQRLGKDLFGVGFETCYRKFGTRAVDTLHGLINAGHTAKSIEEAKGLMVKRYQSVFKVSKKDSESSICVLAGAGALGTPNCQIFGPAIAKICRP